MIKRTELELKGRVGTGRAAKMLELLETDVEVNALLEQANKVMISRMGYNDHGVVHAKISANHSLHILDLLVKSGMSPAVVAEGIGTVEDAMVVTLLGAYLHDIGCAVNRELHELHGMTMAAPLAQRLLSSLYGDTGRAARMCCIVLECVLCHMPLHYKPTSLEAKAVEVGDGMDMTAGRARIPFMTSSQDIHKLSALSITDAKIKRGAKKALTIEVLMSSAAGAFQIEKVLLPKIKDAGLDECIEIVARSKLENLTLHY